MKKHNYANNGVPTTRYIIPHEHIVVVAEHIGEGVDALNGLVCDDGCVGGGRGCVELLRCEAVLDAPKQKHDDRRHEQLYGLQKKRGGGTSDR